MQSLHELFAPLDHWVDIIHFGESDPVEKLGCAIEEKNYPAAYSALRQLGKPLSGGQAAECLAGALDCTPQLFRAILSRCVPGEYAYAAELPSPVDALRAIPVKGTILALAAAMNRSKHLKILLEQGWDADGCAPTATQAMYDAFSEELDFGREAPGVLQHSVPLAAAIFFGSTEAIRELLPWVAPGKLRSEPVTRAAVYALRGTKQRREGVRLALGLKSSADDEAALMREFWAEWAAELADVAELCTAEEFTLRLSGGCCSREELLAAVEALCPHSLAVALPGTDEKLLLLLDRYPELGAEPRVRDRLLNATVSRMLSGAPFAKLLARWKAACGQRRDVSNVDEALLDVLAKRSKREQISCLHTLGEGGTLFASADKATWIRLTKRSAQLAWLNHVDVVRTDGCGVSRLARELIWMDDEKIFRWAASRGALRGERKDELLMMLRESGGRQALRAALLALPKEQIGDPAARPQEELIEGQREWDAMDEVEQAAYLEEMWTTALDAGECERRLRLGGWIGKREKTPLCRTELDGMQICSMPAAACCGRNAALLRVLLEHGVCDPEKRISESWCGSFSGETLRGTMLCLAAAAGRTEQVRLLLKAGLDPNENDVPERSVYWDGMFAAPEVVTPLNMAQRRGFYETAELLHEHGAYAYPG